MSKHKSEDYKITVVKYYLENDTNYTKTCDIFKCSERSLKRWIERYDELEEVKRLNRKSKSYKITKEHVKYAIQKLKENEQITINTIALRYWIWIYIIIYYLLLYLSLSDIIFQNLLDVIYFGK